VASPEPIQCQVCGVEGDPKVVAMLALHDRDYWAMHRIELKGGVIEVLTCPDCDVLTPDLILESYMHRIRKGLIPGYH
jgi:hypothetical protein